MYDQPIDPGLLSRRRMTAGGSAGGLLTVAGHAMTTRRDFLLQAAVTAGAIAGLGANTASGGVALEPVCKPLRVLILGATGFIGPHFVQAAMNRGHKVSVFSRGKEDT